MKMYKVKSDFRDLLKGNHPYKTGDAYEEKSERWTQYLVETGKIEKVVIEQKKEKKFFGKNEDVAKEQE